MVSSCAAMLTPHSRGPDPRDITENHSILEQKDRLTD